MTAERRQMGAYRLHERIGAGGMGEVYRARDTKLGRDVAIKLLPPNAGSDPQYRARFEREARILAALTHPNIAAIYGVEDATDQGPPLQGLVLEFVDGETVADRLRRGPLPQKDALTIAARVADALEAAHAKGIIHRDLTPSNIKITPAGIVKVLDFGLAKMADHGPHEIVSQATTVALVATRQGVVLGTAPYMSPEQARGEAVDERADIWALGCVLYEMLIGRAAFRRASITDTLAAIIEREPVWADLPRTTPPAIVRLLRRCLEKESRRRIHHMADVRIELEDALANPGPQQWNTRTGSAWWHPVVTAAALLVAASSLALWLNDTSAPVEPAAPTRLSVSVSGVVTPQTSVAISPDSQRIAYVSTDSSGRSMLWVRELDSLEPRPLTGTEDAAHPFWSPDGRSLGFLAGGKVKRVDLAGGVLTLAETNVRGGGSWSTGGTILFAPRPSELAVVPAAGGAVTPVLTGAGAGWPFFLPDGRHFLFVGREGDGPHGVYVGSIDSPTSRHLLTTDFKAAYAEPGYLLFVRGETLMAQPFDASTHELRGEAVPVAEGVWTFLGAAQASFSASGGALAYVNSSLLNRELIWFDRAGQSLGPLGPADRYAVVPELSPDGTRVAVARGLDGQEDVWVVDLADGTRTRVTLGPTSDRVPKWAADSRRIVYMSSGAEGQALWSTDALSPSSPDAIAKLSGGSHLWDWSRDGRFAVYSTIGPQGAADLWVLPTTGEQRPYPFAESSFHKTQAQISPNGRWLAYTSYESGRDEVYLESFPAPGQRRQLSADGGMQPRWRPDGGELFYLGSDQYLMSVPLTADQIPAGAPQPLFRTRLIPQGSQSVWFDIAYDVMPQGDRFLLTNPSSDLGPPITVVLNWLAAVRR